MKILSSTFALPLLFSAFSIQPLALLGQTPVMFPLAQMFGGANYAKKFSLQAAQSFISNGTNAWIGSSVEVTPTGGTNPVVYLTPNTYLVRFPDATYPWRIAVPNTTNRLNALNLSTGPLPTFLVQPATPLAAGPGIGITKTDGTNVVSALFPAPPNYRLTFAYYAVGIGAATNGVWLYGGTSPTNFILTSSNTLYLDTNSTPAITVRDSFVCPWTPNGAVSPKYILSYTTHYGDPLSSGTPGPGVAVSDDGLHFSFLGYANLTTNYYAQWSPKFAVNATNGLIATIGLGPGAASAPPTNPVVFDVNVTNPTQWSNPRPIPEAPLLGQTDVSAGLILFTNGLYYYFAGAGAELTNSTLDPGGWGVLNWNPNGTWGNPGPTVFFGNGLWYWFTTGAGLAYITSPDLVNWTPNVFASAVYGNIVLGSTGGEGAIVPEPFCTPPPVLQLPNGQAYYPHQNGTNIFWSTSP